MTDLSELKKRAEDNGFLYAYGMFKDNVEPPHLVAYETDVTNFIADGVVYKKKIAVKLDYTYDFKDLTMQNKIEDIILHDVVWNKSEETYLDNENCWQVSYFFELIEEE